MSLTTNLTEEGRGSVFEIRYPYLDMYANEQQIHYSYFETVALGTRRRFGLGPLREEGEKKEMADQIVSVKAPDQLSRDSIIFYFNFFEVWWDTTGEGNHVARHIYRAMVLSCYSRQSGIILCRMLHSTTPTQEEAMLRCRKLHPQNHWVSHAIGLTKFARKESYSLRIKGIITAREDKALPDPENVAKDRVVIDKHIVLVPVPQVHGEIFYHRLS